MIQTYLETVFAEAPVHGLFSVRKTRDGLKKQPQGEHGCASFCSPANELKPSKTLLLGRAFGAGDNVIGIDVDNEIPEPAWHSGTGYREVSASGTGLHIIARIPAELIPASGSKIVLKGQEHNIEIFYGKNNGIALTGEQAAYTVPDLDMFSPAGQLAKAELEKKIKQLAEPRQPTSRKMEVPAAPRNSCEELAGIITTTQRWAILSNKTLPSSASEAFQAVCNRIAGDLGQMEAYTAHTDILTTTNIRVVWESTEIYRHHYAGKKKYAAHKIDPTLQKALIYGLKRKSEALASMKWSKKKTTPEAAKSEPKPQQTQKLEPEKPKHPEGFCVSEDGVPEFWCDEYDHPLRYHMAHIARYAQTAMQQPNAITAWICAVFFGTVVCARQYAAELVPFGKSDSSALIFPRLYAIVAGKSGAGKDDVKNGLRALVRAVAEGGKNKKLWGLISPYSNWTSDAAVHAAIAENPQSVAIWDECGRKIQRANEDAIAGSMMSKITEAFSQANDVLVAPHYANPKDQQQSKGLHVYHPAMSIIGLGTPRQMESITEDMVENGQFARFLYYEIPLCITKPVEQSDFDFKTHAAVNTILATATFAPDVRITARQQVLRVLRWDPNAPTSAAALRDSVRELAIAAKSDADVAILNRVFEIAGILAISRTILGTKRGLGAEYIEYDTMSECIEEAKKSMWHFHGIIVDAPVYTPRELRIADAIEEIFRKELQSPFRAYYGLDIAPSLKKQKIVISGKLGERQNVDAILRDRGIAVGKEGNTPTGRKYYYDASTPTAQAEQDDYDAQLKTAAKFKNTSR